MGLAKLLDPPHDSSAVLRIESDRGFLTYTGVYKGKATSIVSIGMGVSISIQLPFTERKVSYILHLS